MIAPLPGTLLMQYAAAAVVVGGGVAACCTHVVRTSVVPVMFDVDRGRFATTVHPLATQEKSLRESATSWSAEASVGIFGFKTSTSQVQRIV